MNNAELVVEIKLLQSSLQGLTELLKQEAANTRVARELAQDLKIQNELLKQSMHQHYQHIREHCLILEEGKGDNKGVLDRLAGLEERNRLEDGIAQAIEKRANQKIYALGGIVAIVEVIEKIWPYVKQIKFE